MHVAIIDSRLGSGTGLNYGGTQRHPGSADQSVKEFPSCSRSLRPKRIATTRPPCNCGKPTKRPKTTRPRCSQPGLVPQAFTAARHILLADRHTVAAQSVRASASYALGRRWNAASEVHIKRALELEAIAQRHRKAAEQAAEKAFKLEQEARGEKQPEQPASSRSSWPNARSSRNAHRSRCSAHSRNSSGRSSPSRRARSKPQPRPTQSPAQSPQEQAPPGRRSAAGAAHDAIAGDAAAAVRRPRYPTRAGHCPARRRSTP